MSKDAPFGRGRPPWARQARPERAAPAPSEVNRLLEDALIGDPADPRGAQRPQRKTQVPLQRPGQRDPRAKEPAIFSVSGLTADLRRRLEHRYARVRVQGEVSNLRIQGSGHAYFTLKDPRAQLACVCFDRARSRLKFQLKDGLELIAGGQLSYYDRGGRLQLIAETATLAGEGVLMQRFHELAEQLAAEGLTAEARKRPLPRYPRAIGVVTSLQAAALQDVLRTLHRRAPQLPVVLSPTEVQGAAAAPKVAAALSRLDRSGQVDVIILARGGGSLEDLWAFNEPAIARAIAKAKTPIITGVGHERDLSIADLVADVRASTPTAAAERVAPPVSELRLELSARLSRAERALGAQLSAYERRLRAVERRIAHPEAALYAPRQRLDEATRRLRDATEARLGQQARRLQRAERALLSASPTAQLSARTARLLSLKSRLAQAMQSRLQSERARLGAAPRALREGLQWRLVGARARLEPLAARLDQAARGAAGQRRSQLDPLRERLPKAIAQLQRGQEQRLRYAAGRLEALSPLAVLARGYALVEGEGGLLYSTEGVEPGDALKVRLHRGRLEAKVTKRLP